MQGTEDKNPLRIPAKILLGNEPAQPLNHLK